MKLVINQLEFIYNTEKTYIDDLFTEDFFRYSNNKANDYYTDLVICNEVFYNQTLKILAVEHFILQKSITQIDVSNADKSVYGLVLDTAKKNNIDVINRKFFIYFLNNLVKQTCIQFMLIVSFVYLFGINILSPYKDLMEKNNDKIALSRSTAAKRKMGYLFNLGLKVHVEDVKRTNTIYNRVPKAIRLFWVIKSYFWSQIELKRYMGYAKKTIGKYTSRDIGVHYSKRVLHTLVYDQLINRYLSRNPNSDFYTGNCIDRFALTEAKIAKKYSVRVVCVPHGMEFGYKFPAGYPCDVHYSTTLHAKKIMNELYNTNRFIYDEKIAKEMLTIKRDNINISKDKKIVFFTEPNEIPVNLNIVSNLVDYLSNKGYVLYLKLHPKDSEVNYLKYENKIKFIDDFNDAISNNICIARKSTVLVEALHNHSISVAILINEKDKATSLTFPSLQDSNINKFFSLKKLKEFLGELLT